MPISLPLKEMTIEEKLQTMESIWDDLCAHPESLPSPTWHGDVLAGREAAVERGDEQFEAWETVRSNIEKNIR